MIAATNITDDCSYKYHTLTYLKNNVQQTWLQCQTYSGMTLCPKFGHIHIFHLGKIPKNTWESNDCGA